MDPILRALTEELQRRGARLETTTGDVVEVRMGDGTVEIGLENLRRRVAGGESLDELVEAFAESAFRAASGRSADAGPQSAEAFRRGLRWSLQPAESVEGFISRPISKQIAWAVTWTHPDEQFDQLVTNETLKRWKVSEPEAWELAAKRMDALISESILERHDVAGAVVLFFASDSSFRASLVAAPSLKAKVESTLGWPIQVVLPARDFVMLFPAGANELMSRIGAVVRKELTQSAYPLSSEVFSLSDEGLKALGAFKI